MKSLTVTIHVKATVQYFSVVLFIMQYKVVLKFESVDEILKCDNSNESYWAVLSGDAVYYAIQGGSLLSLWMKSLSVTIQMKATEHYFLVELFTTLHTVVLNPDVFSINSQLIISDYIVQ